MPEGNYNILLLEDEEPVIAALQLVLMPRYSLRVARRIAEAQRECREQRPDLILLDLGLPDGSGVDFLRRLRKRDKALDVVVITGTRDVSIAVEVMKLGAQDYLQKPFGQEDLLLCVQRTHARWQLASEVDRLRDELYEPFHWESIIGDSPAMRQALARARKVATSDSTILITGETGTGKDLIARAIHCEGKRRHGPFVAVNCPQFTATLLESELFGHEKGSFTGATARRKGRFELANDGTIFLDEIGNTAPEMQAKILRVLETKCFERVGGEESIRTDFRLIAATNANLEADVRAGKFREDLYYRLNVVPIPVPPLRERRGDIELLCRHILERHARKTGHAFEGITPEAMDVLQAWHWPGNVRELQNVLETTMTLEDDEWITSRYLPSYMITSAGIAPAATAKGSRSILKATVEDFERRFLVEQLRLHNWNHRKTARALRVHRNTVEEKILKYGISDDESR